MRAPNGYGSVSKLPGKRRKPWRLRVTTGYSIDADGYRHQQTKTIGYYTTRAEAYAARDEYNQHKGQLSNADYLITFDEVYSMWAETALPELSRTAGNRYQTARKKAERIAQTPIKDITFLQLQSIVDDSSGGAASKEALKTMLKKVFEYAELRGMVNRNLAVGISVPAREKSTKHYLFTAEEINILWEHQEDDIAAFALMLIYSGMRPGELFALKQEDVDLSNNCLHIVAGKNQNAIRTVPIHPATYPLFEERMNGEEHLITIHGHYYSFGEDHDYYIKKEWKPTLQKFGILNYVHPDSGETQPHLPHDCRHTFTTQWKRQRLDDPIRCYIQGHSLQGIGAQVYTHLSPADLLEELEKLDYFQ